MTFLAMLPALSVYYCFHNMLPRFFSALSGCIWAGIAWLLLDQGINAGVAGGMLASPLIGIAIGSFSKSFRERPLLHRAALALLTLYLATVLFGIAGGMSEAAFGARQVQMAGQIVESVWALVLGLTISGYFFVLWPLAFLNHAVIARVWSESNPVATA